MGIEGMSPYDRAAWDHCINEIYRPDGRKLPAWVRDAARKAGTAISRGYTALPGTDRFDALLERAFDGALALTFQPALASVRASRVVQQFASRHPGVTRLEDVRKLDLEACDKMLPPRFGYTVVAAVQGGSTALAVTGAEVSSTVSGGVTAGVAVAALATDVIASLALMGRSIGVVAARYGYDVTLPEEELFALGVLSLGTASSLGGKTTAMASLSRLTQKMMRHATWAQLKEHTLVSVIDAVYKALGFKLTKQKLAEVVPLAGVGFNAVLSAEMTDRTFRRAKAVYRLRFLSEKYGIDPKTWMRDSGHTDEAVVEVDNFLDEGLSSGTAQGPEAGELGKTRNADDSDERPDAQ
ncbi:EcsC family protein [Sphaerisporangium perillae]|uniref:EcsC family protein n=1 Tax=Sphaerisporangium perillae TaxID=2935860 RepID=UPI00200E7CA6|nr:EcsC family protein [Sphaerisporangium perillae]